MNDLTPLLLFDGVCNLCNRTVQIIIDRDPKGLIHFSSLQSDYAKKVLMLHGLNPIGMNSIVLILGSHYYTKSDAVLEVMKILYPGAWWIPIFSWFPKFLRNFGYDLIARNRYRFFGKRETCMVPLPDLKSRFFD